MSTETAVPASETSSGNPASGAPAVEDAQVEQNGTTEPVQDDAEHVDDTPFPLTIVLPHDNQSFELPVSPLEQIHEIRQSIIEHPIALQYSCFRLEHSGERVNDYTQVSEIKGLGAGSQLHIVEEPYTEKEARIHVIRIRELIGAAGDRTDTVQGVLAGASIYDDVTVAEPKEGAEASKEVPEYKFDAEPALTSLIPKETDPAPKAVKSIALSSWNPPPAHLRQKGHLLYLVVSTNEGEQWQITAHVGGFFVNKCSNAKFDPFRNTTARGYAEHSLFTLLQKMSPSFTTTFAEFQEFANRRDPLATFQVGNAIPSAPWLVPSTASPLCHHSSDPTRSQETYLLAGAENTDSLRDWNEEFQSARELPRESIQDRVFRERLISKLFADYNDAAARGAVLVARGEVAPLNPTEGRDAQIFVYNNVFFSFGADGVGTFTSEGGDDAARVATGKDVFGVKLVNQLDIDGLYTPGTVVVDYLGKRIVGQSIVPGIFKQPEPGENQIHYGAVDGKEHVSADERFVSAFEKLATALRVKKHPVWDKENKRFDLEASVEMKGLLGTDGRKYVLDLYRITPLDIAWMEESGPEDSEDSKYPHRMTVLRPELVEALGKQKAREFINAELARRGEVAKEKKAAEGSKEDGAKPEDAEKAERVEDEEDKKDEGKPKEEEKADRIDMANFKFALNPDVFSGQAPQTEEEKAEMAEDEQDVRDACAYLRDVIKTLIKDLRESDISFPMDGRSLTKLLHRRGVNVRYLGLLAKLSEEEGSRLECFRHLCVQEMISRSFKHIAGRYLRYLPLPLTASCFSHLLNCLLGFGLNPRPVVEIDETLKALYDDADLSFEKVTPESLRKDIERETARRYRYTLAENWWGQIRHTQLLREVALKLGLQIQVKNFVFVGEVEAPAAKEQVATESKKGKKKKARDGSPASIASSSTVPHTFTTEDFVNVVPLVKDSAPRSTLAEEALEGGRLSIYQGQRKLGEDLLLESLSLHEQIYGLVHPEVAQMYHTLSQMYYQLDQKEAAVELARKAAIVSERTVGLDAAETILNYLNLSLFLHQRGDSQLALAYSKHALGMWKIIYGTDHPDTITTMNNYAVMLQSIKAYHESRRWFEESLRVCELVFGRKSVNSATLLFQLAQALALDSDAKQAVDRMRESYTIFKDILGPEDKNTKEAEHWLEQLLHNAVSIAKQAKDQARNARTGFPFATRGLGMRGATNAANDIAGKPPAPMTDSRSLDELVHFIEGTDKKKTSGADGKKRTGRANPKRRGSAAVRS
ncbi:clustered mitochondria-domain-containing protein [Immersiella caudata]|uniref:Clustered mitochondria protein homolog n=1 Tax=Immersiella caudata TaxID=314043 RepID=A0AA39WX88_9PEZI|nr:clustered mitochondria-domain-containing protein [Immersiella caudata]